MNISSVGRPVQPVPAQPPAPVADADTTAAVVAAATVLRNGPVTAALAQRLDVTV